MEEQKKDSQFWFIRQDGFHWLPKPARFEGWLLLSAYGALLIWDFIRIDTASHSAADTLIAFGPDFIILTLLFLVFVFLTSGTEKNTAE